MGAKMYVTAPGGISAVSESSGALFAPPSAQTTRTLKVDQCLYREGDEASHVFEITSGVLRLTRVLENGRRQVIAFGYPGDIIGFPYGGAYQSECDAIAPSQVIAHRRSTLEGRTGNRKLHARLLQAALHEIGSMQDHFLMLGRKSAREKTASFLLALSKRVGKPLGDCTQVSIPMNRSDIGDFLGLTAETVCRNLSQLRTGGIIAMEDPHSIIILKPEALLALSEDG